MIASWTTYNISDFILFSEAALQSVYKTYNQGIWPTQLGWLAVSAAISCMLVLRLKNERLIFSALSAAWLFVGGFFHLHYFSSINPWASVIAAIFGIQGLLIFALGSATSKLRIRQQKNLRTTIGFLVFLINAFIPWNWFLIDAPYSAILLFGWGPTSTALGSLGIFLIARVSWSHILLWPIPVLWCLVTFLVHFSLR